jgi:Essential protein Yae1, N terminal
MSDDILDSVLNLEEASYQAGLEEGKADGAKAGYTEGKIFGIERGYQRGLEMGKLHGRAEMLNACLSDPNPWPEDATRPPPQRLANNAVTADFTNEIDNTIAVPKLPTLTENPRLKKHVETLLRLTDPRTLKEDNSDEAIDEFDDRMRKALAKAKVIDRMIAEPYNMTVSRSALDNESQPAAGSGNIEELSSTAVRR